MPSRLEPIFYLANSIDIVGEPGGPRVGGLHQKHQACNHPPFTPFQRLLSTYPRIVMSFLSLPFIQMVPHPLLLSSPVVRQPLCFHSIHSCLFQHSLLIQNSLPFCPPVFSSPSKTSHKPSIVAFVTLLFSILITFPILSSVFFLSIDFTPTSSLHPTCSRVFRYLSQRLTSLITIP